MSHAEACARLTSQIEALGREAAYRVVDRLQTYGYPPEDIPELVGDEREVLRLRLAEKIRPADLEVIERVFSLALVREAKRVLAALDGQGGTA